MRPLLSMALALNVASASMAVASGLLPEIGGDPARGRDTFVERGCLACHSVRGTGGQVGPDLARALVGKGMLAISAAMLNHFPQMLAARGEKQEVTLPALSPTQLDDVIAYLFAINFATEPGSASRGRVVFNEVGCVRCHAPALAAGANAPTLGRGSIDASPLVIAQSMWNHGARMWQDARARGVPLRRFEPGEFADLLAFLGARSVPFGAHGFPLPGDPRVGRSVFEAKGCARCHTRGEGQAAVEHDLAAGWYQAPSEVAAAMWNHGPEMWARMKELAIPAAELGDDDMANVISFLYLLRSAGTPGEAKRGALVFQRKECVRCHGVDGTAPQLLGRTDLDTPIHFAAVMWNHAPRMNELLAKEGVPWPTFSADDVRDLVAYVRRQPPGGL